MFSLHDNQSFDSSDPEDYEPSQTVHNVSVLKHLPDALKILQGQHYQQQYARCMYDTALSRIPNMVIPRVEKQTNQVNPNRLFKIEDTMFEHLKMKEKIQSLFDKGKQKKQFSDTLWTIYSGMKPSYARFGVQVKKNNFANVFMPLNGVNILLSLGNGNKKTEQTNFYSSTPDSVRFDSHFESGNLLYAFRKESNEIETYDLILQNDINTKGHNQWFFFKMTNMKKHNKIKLNIVNFIKDQSMFSYGIKPLTFSQRNYNKNKIGWVRCGERISYEENNIKRQYKDKSYYTLSFQYYFTDADTVYFSPIFPYTFTQLSQYFDTIIQNPSLNKIVSIKPTVETIGKNVTSIITISAGEQSASDSKIVWILGRQHPGQTTSNYMIQGIVNHLLNLYSSYSKINDKLGLHNFIFKIVPMINVDGVIHGNTRSELTGIDPNRMWKKPLRRLCPSISSIKKQILRNKQNVCMILDLHSHSKKTGCFFYGNTLMHNPKISQLYPSFVCSNDRRFSIENCRYRGGYQTTARKVLFQELSIPYIYTVECSLLGYIDKKTNRIMDYKVQDYNEMGKHLIDSFLNLEKVKITKQIKQIIEDMGIEDRNQVESARSESSLSDEEYEEICFKAKTKFRKVIKPKNKKIKEEAENAKSYYVKKVIPKEKVTRKNHRTTKNCLKQTALNYVKHKNSRSLISNNQGETIERSTKTPPHKMQQKNIIKAANFVQTKGTEVEKEKSNEKPTKVYRIPLYKNIVKETIPVQAKDFQIQVSLSPISKSNTRYKLKTKNDQLLYVVGSSLQDEHISVFKNQVSVQVYEDMFKKSENDQTPKIGKKESKLKKMPKILNYLCSNLIGVPKQNAILPQEKKMGNMNRKKLSGNALGVKN